VQRVVARAILVRRQPLDEAVSCPTAGCSSRRRRHRRYVRWLLDLLYGGTDDAAHARAEAAVAEVGDGGRPLLTHLGPCIFNLGEMNPFQPAGIVFRFPLLHMDRPTRGDLLRGFFENVVFSIRGNCEQIAEVDGQATDRLWVSGGMTRSPTLLAMLAATVQVPLVVGDVTESASLGCAVLAPSAAGSIDLASAVDGMVPRRRRAGRGTHGVFRRSLSALARDLRDVPLVDAVIGGVLLDLDGTLADTEPLQWEAYRRVLAPFGVDVGIEEYRRRWIAVEGGAEYACRAYRLPIDAAELRARKAIAYRTIIAAGVVPRPGAREVLERLAARYRLAVVTNSVRSEVAVVLDHLGIGARLDAVVAREDYDEAKPAPDAYRAGARALGLAAHECVVVEDTARGVRAGVAAGCIVVAVPSELTRDNDFTGAARRLARLDEVTDELLQDLAGAR
jgi:HAD superfamily hydrolase (TIGR01509 family)